MAEYAGNSDSQLKTTYMLMYAAVDLYECLGGGQSEIRIGNEKYRIAWIHGIEEPLHDALVVADRSIVEGDLAVGIEVPDIGVVVFEGLRDEVLAAVECCGMKRCPFVEAESVIEALP